MWTTLRLPETGIEPLGKPHCPYCRAANTRVYERIMKRVKHPDRTFVSVVRRRCGKCGRTFRHYPPGASRATQTATVKALSVLLYSIGLSYGQIVNLLEDQGAKLVKSTVWRSIRRTGKKVYYLHRQSLRRKVKVKGMTTNLFRTKGGEVPGSIVSDLLQGKGLELECLDAEGGPALAAAFVDIAEKLGVESTIRRKERAIRNPNELAEVRRDLRVSGLRKSIKRRAKYLIREAELFMRKGKSKEKQRVQELLDDCKTILDVIEHSRGGWEKDLWEIYKRYTWAKGPHKGETATLWYKMRLFTLRVWDKSRKIVNQHEPSKKT